MRNRTTPRAQRALTTSLSGLLAGALGLTLGLGLGTPTAHAGGYDWPGLGTRGMGRAGAWGVRSDSPLALHVNPANLARLTGINAELSLHLASLQACFDRDGTPTRDGLGNARALEGTDARNANDFGDPDDYANVEYPEVCNGAGIFPIPQLGLSFRPHERVGVGVGIVAPNNVGHRYFGQPDGANIGTYAVPGSPTGRLPAPSRYDVIEANVLLAFLAVGVGVEVHPRLRVGASFGYGFANTGFTTAVTPVQGEDFARDIIATVDAQDWFVPRIGLSVDAEPIDGLEVMAAFTWTADVEAEGDLNLQPLFWASDPNAQGNPPRTTDVGWESVTYPVALTAPQTSVLNAGVRYAHRRAGAPAPGEAPIVAETGGTQEVAAFDPLRDEVFDIEADLSVVFGKRVDGFDVVSGSGPRLVNGVLPLTQPPALSLEHNWKTQIMIAVGSDINVIPEVLALRLGVAYETDGIQNGQERLDFMPWERIAASFGMTLRIQRFELSLAYMHLHWFTRNNSTPVDSDAPVTGDGQIRSTVAAGEGTIVNSGRFTANADLVSIGLAYRFR